MGVLSGQILVNSRECFEPFQSDVAINRIGSLPLDIRGLSESRERTHQIPRGLQVDEVIELGIKTTRQMEIVEDGA